MNFTENGKEGRPAIALIAKTSRRIADPAKPGLGGDHNKVDVPAGYIRAVRLIPQADAGGLRQVRRELLAIVGGDCGKGDRRKRFSGSHLYNSRHYLRIHPKLPPVPRCIKRGGGGVGFSSARTSSGNKTLIPQTIASALLGLFSPM